MMITFKSFLLEVHAAGIQHLEHPSDRVFDSPEAATHAVNTLKGITSGKTPITRKIDDKMSFQAIRTPEGKVGVKYKGAGAHYNYTPQDVEKQHGHKPYLAHPLKSLLTHIGKVLPHRAGEYQGGFMSTSETRHEKGGKIGHTPNTIEYSTPSNSEEGKKLKRSKVSAVIHTELKGPKREPVPITSMHEFHSHPDVHLVQHVVEPAGRHISAEDKKTINSHISQAEKLMKGHDYSHLSGHESTLRNYINSTVRSGTTPNVAGYKQHLSDYHNKKIEAVKTQKSKEAKTAEKSAALQHVTKNAPAFAKSLQIHHHIQQATNHLARSLDKASKGGFETRIGGKETNGEGYVGGGLKVVDRSEFSRLNSARSAQLRAARGSV
jgi:hypothetical protein